MKRSEAFARLFAITFSLGIVLVPLGMRFWPQERIDIHAQMAENGGWTPAVIQARVGIPLHLHLASDDVKHGFAVGKMDMQSVDLEPGKPVNLTLAFDKPGTYTFYCTHWCGVNHWRMRGTIEVTAAQGNSPALTLESVSSPLYVTLGLDIDAPHPAAVIPIRKPSTLRGRIAATLLPKNDLLRTYLTFEYYRSHSPAQAFADLRTNPTLKSFDDSQVWDLVALVWQSNSTPVELAQGRELYAQNCAACHGEDMTGNGVFAEKLTAAGEESSQSMEMKKPASFSNLSNMFGVSPALLEGKIIRGGMGTGMPMWGTIFTDEKIKSIIGYLYTQMFDYSNP